MDKKEKNEKLTRRQMLGLGTAAGTVLLAGYATGLRGREKEGKKVMPQSNQVIGKPGTAVKTGTNSEMVYPWPYRILDIKETQERAYRGYFKGGCMFAVVEALAGQVAEKLGKPYTDFPFAMSTYGGGGVAGWGSLCGTCNGAAMALALFQEGKNRNLMINELYAWYEDAALPSFIPSKPMKVKQDYQMKNSSSGSILCHISITRWVKASKEESYSPARLERCARIAADVAGFTAGLLNRESEKQFTSGKQITAAANSCLACHARGKQAPHEPEIVGRMNCTTCHGTPHDD